MQGILVVSEDGAEMLIVIPDPSNPRQLLVCVEFMGLEAPPVPVPVEAFEALLEQLNGKS